MPPHERLVLRLVSWPYRPNLVRLLNGGGPAILASGRSQGQNRVLVSVDQANWTLLDLREAISDDGRRRNLHWKLVDGSGDILRLDVAQQGQESGVIRADEIARMGPSGTTHNNKPFPATSTFIISFKDRHEARRFVREWHRRALPERRKASVSDPPPPVLNAQILW